MLSNYLDSSEFEIDFLALEKDKDSNFHTMNTVPQNSQNSIFKQFSNVYGSIRGVPFDEIVNKLFLSR